MKRLIVTLTLLLCICYVIEAQTRMVTVAKKKASGVAGISFAKIDTTTYAQWDASLLDDHPAVLSFTTAAGDNPCLIFAARTEMSGINRGIDSIVADDGRRMAVIDTNRHWNENISAATFVITGLSTGAHTFSVYHNGGNFSFVSSSFTQFNGVDQTTPIVAHGFVWFWYEGTDVSLTISNSTNHWLYAINQTITDISNSAGTTDGQIYRSRWRINYTATHITTASVVTAATFTNTGNGGGVISGMVLNPAE